MKLFLCLVLLLSLSLTGFLTVTMAETQSPCTLSNGCKISVDRTIQTNDWGTTTVEDTIKVNATTQVTYVDIGVPSLVADKIGFLAAEVNGTSLRAVRLSENQTAGYVPVRVELPGKDGRYSVSLKTVFGGLLGFNGTKYTFAFSAFPVVDGLTKVTSANYTIRTGDWANMNLTGVQGTSSSGTFKGTTNNLAAFNVTIGELTFTSASQNAFQVSAARDITISASGRVSVTDSYNITNRGRDVPSLLFTLPQGSTAIGGSDVVGPLDTTKIVVATQANGTNQVTFVPRFGTIKNQGGADLRLQYDLTGNTYVAMESLGRYSLNFRMFDNVKFVEPSLQTRVLPPAGFKLESVTGPSAAVSGDKIVLETSSVSPLSDLSFSISYRLDPFWASFSPLAWSTLLEGAVAAAALVYLAGASRQAAVGLAPSGLLTRFVDLSDEKTALRLESEKLEDDMARGALGRHDFRRRRRTIDLRTAEIDRQLGPVKQEVAGLSSRYSDLVKRLERAEAELQVVRGSISDLRNQYRGGRMARELYESMSSDLARRKERAQQTMDNIIIGLREEAR